MLILICIMTAMTQKTFPCSIKSCTVQRRQNCPIFQPPIETLVPTPHPILPRLVLRRVWRAPWTLHFLGCLPNVSIVHLYPFVLIQSMRQARAKKFDVCILTSSIRSINPHDIPCKNVHPDLVLQSAFPFKLEQKKGFPGMAGPCCGMRTSVPSTLTRQLFRLPLSFLLSKTILRK